MRRAVRDDKSGMPCVREARTCRTAERCRSAVLDLQPVCSIRWLVHRSDLQVIAERVAHGGLPGVG
jgi:hypothetical protein